MSQVIPTRLSTELDAVNVLLSSIGEAPVSDLTITESVDVALAVDRLREVDLATQSKGWEWNRDYAWNLLPNPDGFLYLPELTLRVEKAYRTYSNSSGLQPVKVARRGDRLYDPINHTFVFTDTVVVDLITRQLWVDMPEAARYFITLAAAKIFQGRFQANQLVNAILEDDVERALSVLEQYEDETDLTNTITGNNSVISALYGRGVRRSRT